MTELTRKNKNDLPDAINTENIVHPETHFQVSRTGWYRLWYKRRTAPGWCALRCFGDVAKKRYDQFLATDNFRNLLIEKSPVKAHSYKSLFKPKYFYQRGF